MLPNVKRPFALPGLFLNRVFFYEISIDFLHFNF
jgi:hypothetical protein